MSRIEQKTPYPIRNTWSDLTSSERTELELRYDGPIPQYAIDDTIRLRQTNKERHET